MFSNSGQHHKEFDRRKSVHLDYIKILLFPSTEIKDAFGGRDALLYKTDYFGSIRNFVQGIEVAENVSPTTFSIALMLADETMNHQPLMLAAVQADLHISFSDKRLQNEFIRRRDLIETLRKPQDKSALKFFNDIVDDIDKKLSALKVSSIMMKSSIKKYPNGHSQHSSTKLYCKNSFSVSKLRKLILVAIILLNSSSTPMSR